MEIWDDFCFFLNIFCYFLNFLRLTFVAVIIKKERVEDLPLPCFLPSFLCFSLSTPLSLFLYFSLWLLCLFNSV